jgi:NAD(P)-dependent dehydrogenase (short-subunit alcohol dehydrogenase family)
MESLFDVSGKTALVTGDGSGMGKAIAQVLGSTFTKMATKILPK